MNGSTNKLSPEELDRLLFDYLEGTLPPAEEGAVEERLLSDSLLQEELENWKEAYAAQDFYSTSALEKRILANTPKPGGFYRWGSAALLLSGLLIALFYFRPFTKAGEEGSIPVAKNMVIMSKQVKTRPENRDSKTAAPDKARETAVPKWPKAPSVTAVAAALPEKPEYSALPAPALKEALPVAEKRLPEATLTPVVLLKEPVKLEKVKIQPPRTAFSVSKKEQRKINRMKRKNQESHLAREFLKGNRPYVVPLNTQNF